MKNLTKINLEECMKAINGIYEEIIHPEITDHLLEDDGQLFYMNSNNGTKFDYFENEHLPALTTFYKGTDSPFSRMFINKNGTVEVLFYKKGEVAPYKEAESSMDENLVKNLANILDYSCDRPGFWNENLSKIEFEDSIPVTIL